MCVMVDDGYDHGIDLGVPENCFGGCKDFGPRYLRKRKWLGKPHKTLTGIGFRNVASRILRRWCQICDPFSHK